MLKISHNRASFRAFVRSVPTALAYVSCRIVQPFPPKFPLINIPSHVRISTSALSPKISDTTWRFSINKKKD